jgi:hypothetical protein
MKPIGMTRARARVLNINRVRSPKTIWAAVGALMTSNDAEDQKKAQTLANLARHWEARRIFRAAEKDNGNFNP